MTMTADDSSLVPQITDGMVIYYVLYIFYIVPRQEYSELRCYSFYGRHVPLSLTHQGALIKYLYISTPLIFLLWESKPSSSFHLRCISTRLSEKPTMGNQNRERRSNSLPKTRNRPTPRNSLDRLLRLPLP